jgi:EAL domain-containing protein (putative c-di-GMP-specific phosphodiesterase class I)
LISPEKFVAVAEETGAILPLGAWVLREACRQQVAWLEAGFPPLRMAINVSPSQILKSDFPAIVAGIIQETGICPNCLELELTERTILGDAELAVEILAELKRLGIRLAIDDFGTGYSGLSYLTRFPIDTLKIDRCFIRDIDRLRSNLAIVRAIMTLGTDLGLHIIAEGVETESELNVIQSCGCDDVQGFHILPPVRADHLECWLRTHTACPEIHLRRLDTGEARPAVDPTKFSHHAGDDVPGRKQDPGNADNVFRRLAL